MQQTSLRRTIGLQPGTAVEIARAAAPQGGCQLTLAVLMMFCQLVLQCWLNLYSNDRLKVAVTLLHSV
jgi:hypothetical protein